MKYSLKATAPEEYFFKEGCYIVEDYNRAEDADVSVATARLTPGTTTRWHDLRFTQERYVILEGEGLAELMIDGQIHQFRLTVGESLRIPPSIPQRITNTGLNDLKFLAVCTPRFNPDNYQDRESSINSSAAES